jgi:hypothetical protein
VALQQNQLDLLYIMAVPCWQPQRHAHRLRMVNVLDEFHNPGAHNPYQPCVGPSIGMWVLHVVASSLHSARPCGGAAVQLTHTIRLCICSICRADSPYQQTHACLTVCSTDLQYTQFIYPSVLLKRPACVCVKFACIGDTSDCARLPLLLLLLPPCLACRPA